MIEQSKEVTRPRSTADKSNKEASENRFNIEFGDRSRPRQVNENDDLNLSIPPGTVPDGFVGEWVIDDGKGSLDRKAQDWWGFLTDSQGVRYARPTGGGKTQYYMVIEKSYYDEAEALRMARYRVNIGEDDSKSLGVQGLESYVPNGAANEIKVRPDRFTDFS